MPSKKPRKKSSKSINKYALYEASVQSPDFHAEWFVDIYKEMRGKFPRAMREDFCGTFKLSCEWVKRNKQNTAIGVDLDPEPLAYGKRKHYASLTADQKKRIKVINENVLSITAPKVDVILACNFSFFIFKDRPTLVRYLRACLRSLRSDGILIVDLAGGPGMIEPMRERKRVTTPETGRFTYTWHQQGFDPITHNSKYSIHFDLEDGTKMKDAFTYDWRLWTIPEVREAMAEAGFSKSTVYWESEHQGEGTGEYIASGNGDNAYAWVSYVIGSP